MLHTRAYFFVYRHIENERINLKWLSEKTLVYLKVLMCGVGSFPDWGRGILQESSSAGWISLKPPSLRSLDETSRNPTDRLLPFRPNPTLTPTFLSHYISVHPVTPQWVKTLKKAIIAPQNTITIIWKQSEFSDDKLIMSLCHVKIGKQHDKIKF